MTNLEVNQKVCGFTVNRVRRIEDAGGTLYEMVHDQTGAQLAWLAREEENKTFTITFKTIPENDTGVFHIIEHTVLNGSKKYPVREPFVELLKGSMQTFLNAFTYPDKTMFPVSSRNETDFMNLMSVYMDAVLHPAIYTNPNIFYQEGWHYEIRDKADEPVYKGVVLNEMKGAFSSVDEILVDEMNRMLFPDNCYKYVSGGDPVHIPELSYEQFLETHSRFYHPSNARVFLDGDLDIEKVLTFIDGEFSEYEKENFDFTIPMQERTAAEHHRVTYETAPGEPMEDKTQFVFGSIVSDFSEIKKNLAYNVLSSVLVMNNESPLKKCLLDENLAQDVEFEMYSGIQQNWAMVVVRNTNEELFDQVKKALTDTVKDLVKNGLNHNEIQATLNQMEFQYRESHEPSGVMNAQRAMDTWLYDGDPAANMTISPLFDELREDAQNGYFENLLAEFFLDEDHLHTLIAVPDDTMGEKRVAAEKERLSEAKKSWGDDVEKYVELNAALDAWQAAADTPEILATLPKLSLSDIEKEPRDYPAVESEYRHIPFRVYPKESSGIVYMNFYFNCAGITREHLPSLGFFVSLLTNLPTKNKSLQQLQEEIKRDVGSLGFYLDSYTPDRDRNVCIPVLGVAVSVLEKNVDKALALAKEVMQETVFDAEHILPLLKQDNEDFRQSLVMNGHSYAMRRTAAHSSADGVFREYVGGYESGIYGKNLEADYDNQINTFLEECRMYQEVLFSDQRLTVSFTDEGNTDAVKAFTDDLSHMDANRARVHYPFLTEKEESALIPAGISYAAVGAVTDTYDPRFQVLSHMLTYDYLWNEVRVKGGAYGTGAAIRPDGTFGFYSYRDPDPANSLKTYRNAADYMRNVSSMEMDFDQYIIGALAAGDPLMSPSARIRLSDSRYFRNITLDQRREYRKTILSMKQSDFEQFADMFENALKDACVCVIGSKNLLESVDEEMKELPQIA